MLLTLLLSLSVTLFYNSQTAEAGKVISLWQSDLLVHPKGIYYNASADAMSLDYYGTRLMSGTIQFYHDAKLTQAGSFKEQFARPDRWLIRSNYTCTGWYVSKIYFSNGDLAVSHTIEVEAGDLKEDRCQSDHTEPTDQEKEDEENGNGIGSGADQTECWSKICKCIADLKAPLDAINTSLGTTNDNLSSINNSINTTNSSIAATNNKLDTLNGTTAVIKDVLTDFRDEFKTNIGYTLPDNPSTKNLLEDNKPVQNEVPFKDETIYFKDEGDATPPPGKLPKAPEPKHWDGFLPEKAIPPEPEIPKEPEMPPEPEQKLDKEIKKDDEIKQDLTPVIDAPLEKDDFKSDAILDPADELNQTLYYERTNVFSGSGGN